MNIKKRTIILISILLILIILWGLIVYIVDPFYMYHKPWLGLEPIAIYNKQEYQILGMARNFEYDSVLVGSSMTENFRASWFNEVYKCNTLKLPFQLGRMKNYDQIFNAIFSTHEVKNVFFGLDFNAIGQNPDQIILHSVPEYIADNNLLNDVQYLYNKDIMFNYLLPYLNQNLMNKVPDFDTAYCWGDTYKFSKEEVLNEYLKVRLNRIIPSIKTNEQVMEYAKENMSVVTKYIEENPNTNFYIFYPPFGILVYDDLIKRSELENCIDILRYSAEEVLKYDNVKLYLFQDMRKIITNIDLYKDTAHYSPEVNQKMIDCLKNDEYRITQDNYNEKFNGLKEFLENYDYESLFK